MVKRKDKVRFGTVLFIIIFVAVLIFGFFFLSSRINLVEQSFSKSNKNSYEMKSSDVRFSDSYWYVVDWPGCEFADEENRVMQDIAILYDVYYYHDHTCKYFLTTYYSDGEVDNRREVTPEGYYLKGLNTFDSYKVDFCCSDRYGNSFCKSREVPSKC